MGALRDRMATDLRLRGLSPITQRMYLACVYRLAAYWRRSPAELGDAEVRAFLTHLVEERQVSPSTQAVSVAALHFFSRVTLDRPEVVRAGSGIRGARRRRCRRS